MKRNGFTLVEVLIALALMAVLLASVAAAMHASLQSIDQNDKIVQVTQLARAVMHQVDEDVRTADAVTAAASQVTIIPPTNAEGLSQVQYELLNGTLYYRRTVNGVLTSYSLLSGGGDVTLNSLAFTSVMGPDYHGVTCTKSVTAHLSLTIGGQHFAVTSSASPRRNQTF